MYAQQYVDNDVLNVEPLELVCLLYSKAIEKLPPGTRPSSRRPPHGTQ